MDKLKPITSFLNINLDKLRYIIYLSRKRYSEAYPNSLFHTFIAYITDTKTGKTCLSPLYFDLTHNVIRYSNYESSFFTLHVGKNDFTKEFGRYCMSKLDYETIVNFEYKNKRTHLQLLGILELLNGVCIPYITFTANKSNKINLGKDITIQLGLGDIHQTYIPIQVQRSNICFNRSINHYSSFKPATLLETLLRTPGYNLTIYENKLNGFVINTYRNLFTKIEIEKINPVFRSLDTITSDEITPSVSVVASNITTAKVVINANTFNGINLLDSLIKWLLTISYWLNGLNCVYDNDGNLISSDTKKVNELYANLNVVFNRLYNIGANNNSKLQDAPITDKELFNEIKMAFTIDALN